tara:strand:+ start:6799 stop:7155 length:357 start_codon:yes stop_codon:yes gene_type:complete
MKVYSFSKQESIVNQNGNIKKYKRVVQHDGKKGIEQVEKDGKVKTRRFKVKNNKRNSRNSRNCKTIMPGILGLRILNKKSNKAKGVTKRRKNKKKRRRRLTRKKVKRNDKGFWEKLFF